MENIFKSKLIPGLVFSIFIVFLIWIIFPEKKPQLDEELPPKVPPAEVGSLFIYNFKNFGVLEESGNMKETSSPYWWLNSGGVFEVGEGVGKTVMGEISSVSKWRKAYAKGNPVDTDGGEHPQNIFRMVTRSEWKNFRQEAYFRIVRDNLSESPNRNDSNGLFLFNRYQDGDNLYYAGVRVDGAAVIKKKVDGIYHTVSYLKIFPGALYDRSANPSLLPKNFWIGIRSEVLDNPDGTVSIRLFADVRRNGNWIKVLEGTDDGKSFGGAVIADAGLAGIRTDFMDVEVADFRIEEL